MGLVTAKLEETAAHVVALSILLLNLRKIQCAFLQFLDWLLGLLQSREKRMVIQWTLSNSTVGNCGFLPSFTNSQQRRNVLETQENRALQGSAVL